MTPGYAEPPVGDSLLGVILVYFLDIPALATRHERSRRLRRSTRSIDDP